MRLEVLFFVALIGIFGSGLCCPDDKNCRQCNTDITPAVCSNCQNSFFDKSTGNCDANVGTAVDNCIEYKKLDDKVVCKTCAEGLYPKGNACTKCAVDGCAGCDENDCYACSKGVLIDIKNQICDSKSLCPIENCNICSNVKGPICLECKSDFTFNKETNRCIKTIENCFEVATEKDTKCSKCNLGFYITADGTCKEQSNSNGGDSGHWVLYTFIVLLIVGGGAAAYYVISKKKDNEDGHYINSDM
jgi:hypothetical protein